MEKEEANGEMSNVVSGSQGSIMEVATALKHLWQSDVDLSIIGDYRAGDIRHAVADLTKVRARLSFNPQFTFNEGIGRSVAWVQGQQVLEDQCDRSIAEMRGKGLYKRSWQKAC